MKKIRSNIMIGLWFLILVLGGCTDIEDEVKIDGVKSDGVKSDGVKSDGVKSDGVKVRFSIGDGSKTNPYEIKNINHLKLLGERKYLENHYKLMNDLDLSGVKNFKPIGNHDFPFKGIFDGNGKVIKNLTIDRATEKYVGLFGKVARGVIKNVRLENVNVKGENYVGGLIGYNSGETIQNVSVTGNVEGKDQVGGLVGSNIGTIEKSYMTGDVKGVKTVGGLAGINGGTIQNSYTTGKVEGVNFVGGLVGSNNKYYSTNQYAKIKKTYTTGNVEGKEDFIGGLAGDNIGTIEESYTTGNVKGRNGVGGLVGDSIGTIANSYTTGNVEGKDKVGGLVGDNGEGPSGDENGSINNSYARGDKMSGTNEVGGLVGNNANNSKIEGKNYWKSTSANKGVGEEVGQKVAVGVVQGKTDERLRALSALETGWSPAIWDFKAGQYPKLNWQSE